MTVNRSIDRVGSEELKHAFVGIAMVCLAQPNNLGWLAIVRVMSLTLISWQITQGNGTMLPFKRPR